MWWLCIGAGLIAAAPLIAVIPLFLDTRINKSDSNKQAICSTNIKIDASYADYIRWKNELWKHGIKR